MYKRDKGVLILRNSDGLGLGHGQSHMNRIGNISYQFGYSEDGLGVGYGQSSKTKAKKIGHGVLAGLCKIFYTLINKQRSETNTSDTNNKSFVQLPQNGNGYYSYESAKRQYGTSACIQTIQDVCLKFFKTTNIEIGINDISFQKGGYMSPHKSSHQHGLNVDIRPLRKDKQQLAVYISDNNNYDHDMTELLVKELLAHQNVKNIIFNDKTIQGLQGLLHDKKGVHVHDNHLHVTMKQ